MAYTGNPYTYPNPDGFGAGSPYASAAPLTITPDTPQLTNSGVYTSSGSGSRTAPWLPAAIGGVASLFGGSGSDHGMGQYSGRENTDASNIDSLAGQQRGLGGEQFDYFGGDTVAQHKATDDLANYYKQDPFTDQRRTADMARMTAGTAGAYQRARTLLAQGNTSANGGSAGVGSAPNSQGAGTANYFANQQAGSIAGAQANEFNNVQADRERRLQAVQGLYAGQAQQDYNQGRGLWGDASGNYQQGFQDWSQLYGQAAAQSQAEAANSPWSTIGQVAPYFAGA